ncbi:hypothetical protein B0H10DRAFT_1699397, partial [Mycena sp. CBHHK59/15]
LSYSKSALVGIVLENLAYGALLRVSLYPLGILARSVPLYAMLTADQRMVLDNKGVVEAFTYAPTTPNAADIYLQSFGNGAMFRTETFIALTIVADIFIV